MIEQIENILAEFKTIQAKLPELRDLFWLKIDRYNEADQQRGVVFDEKFEQQRDKLFRAIDNFSTFIGKSFAPSAEEVAKGKALQKLRAEFSSFDDWNEEAKKALLEREIADCAVKTPKKLNKKEAHLNSLVFYSCFFFWVFEITLSKRDLNSVYHSKIRIFDSTPRANLEVVWIFSS